MTFSHRSRRPILPALLTAAALAAPLGLVFPAAAAPPDGEAQAAPAEREHAFRINERLGRGINLGNTFEAPSLGEWGVTLEPHHLPAIAAAGFRHVRIPTRWTARAGQEPPYTVDPEFFRRIDGVLDECERLGLAAVLNMHHEEGIYEDPDAHDDRLIAVWQQIAERYEDRPDTLVFELLNEPNAELDAEAWNELHPRMLAAVRETNPHRVVMIGGSQWNSIDGLQNLELPDDPNLIATFHYYNPFHFTHQGAEWAGNESQNWLGTTWTGTSEQRKALEADFDRAEQWGREHGRPLYLGEFGAYSKAPEESRIIWTGAVRNAAEERDMSFAYWEFGAGFGAYDREADEWREPLARALGADPEAKPKAASEDRQPSDNR